MRWSPRQPRTRAGAALTAVAAVGAGGRLGHAESRRAVAWRGATPRLLRTRRPPRDAGDGISALVGVEPLPSRPARAEPSLPPGRPGLARRRRGHRGLDGWRRDARLRLGRGARLAGAAGRPRSARRRRGGRRVVRGGERRGEPVGAGHGRRRRRAGPCRSRIHAPPRGSVVHPPLARSRRPATGAGPRRVSAAPRRAARAAGSARAGGRARRRVVGRRPVEGRRAGLPTAS